MKLVTRLGTFVGVAGAMAVSILGEGTCAQRAAEAAVRENGCSSSSVRKVSKEGERTGGKSPELNYTTFEVDACPKVGRVVVLSTRMMLLFPTAEVDTIEPPSRPKPAP